MKDERATHDEEVAFRLRVVAAIERQGGGVRLRRDIAKLIGVDERTIRRWEQRVREGKPVYAKRGRKPGDVARAKRQALLGEMIRLGPYGGVPALRAKFEDVPYRFIARMKRRLLRVVRRRRRWYRKRLLWLRAGAIWAMDFTKPKAGLWHGKDRMFVVRDLGSGAQLAAVACRGEKARTACAVLFSLFSIFGAPLVLKMDNGGAFRSHRARALLAAHEVTRLYSPPRVPQYNGACERSIGTFKRRVDHIASMAGRAGNWLPQDLDEALFVANTTSRPWGAAGPTPAEALESRRSVTRIERAKFERTRACELRLALRTFKERNGRMPTCYERAAIDRRSVQSALCTNGYLEFRRGRLSTLVSAWRTGIKA